MALLLGIAGSCRISNDDNAQKNNPNSVTIMTWNMQALFDGRDDGNEYDEYRASAGWSAEKYRGRLSVISKAISGMSTMPDIIAALEIESPAVIKDLASSISGNR